MNRESSIVLDLILLLTSGQRIPYQIGEQYLESRNINISGVSENGEKDPYSISIYTLKELIQREWKEEWGIKPNSPSSIRLIYFGRLLDDNLLLKNCRFNNTSSNIVHMTVRPQDIGDEEDTSKSKITSKDRENREITAGCRCTLM
ncbi:putative e3 ubiquitin-protein ligase [Erysiphe neolycopersici]|uniref:Putative e3 ubiquitin-protein ligase n=1 Tax=Erysiphe neolycopersici TaxID=212602 RepID=A0A420HMU6_9PEZI|nr:putative e3 ubiquitin-protein ligase [Erysiphe neolycopersici]